MNEEKVPYLDLRNLSNLHPNWINMELVTSGWGKEANTKSLYVTNVNQLLSSSEANEGGSLVMLNFGPELRQSSLDLNLILPGRMDVPRHPKNTTAEIEFAIAKPDLSPRFYSYRKVNFQIECRED